MIMNPFITAHRALLLVALLLASSVGASTITPQIGGGINQFDGGISNGGGSVTPPPTCSPGGPTGQMDFSVCSNIAITAATW